MQSVKPDETIISTIAEPTIGYSTPLFKHGRSTATTSGRRNASDSYVRFENTEQALKSTEMIVVSDNLALGFTEPGDYGAWVIDDVGNLIGMAWGGFTSREGTFVTPIEALADDILGKTGLRMRLPGGEFI